MINLSTTDELLRLRARFVQVLAWGMILVGIIGLPPTIIASVQSGALNIGIPAILIVIALNGVFLVLVNRGRQQIAEVGIIITFTVAALTSPVAFLLMATLAVLTAATLGSTPIFVAANVLLLGKLGFDTLQFMQTSGVETNTVLFNYAIPLMALFAISLVTRYFNNAAQRSIVTTRRTTNFLQASADINRITARLLDLNDILTQSVSLLKARFNFDHAQVYLVNEGEGAVLASASSAPGRGLLNRGYRVPVGARNAIGQVVLSGSSLLRNLQPSEMPQGEDVFPDTRSQLVLPLRDGEKVIGAIDLQSEEANFFLLTDVQALQVLADLLATSVRNVQLYETQAKVAEENKRLYEQSETNLREIERLNQQLTHTSWQEYIRTAQPMPGVTLSEDRLIPDAGWTDALTQAQQERRAVSRVDGEQPVVAVPITLRGEVIGAIEVEPGAQANGADAIEMVEAVAQRLAISLESARLYEETQRATVHEQRINDIAARYQEVTTVDELLRITLQELSETLGAEHGVIRLGNIQEVSA